MIIEIYSESAGIPIFTASRDAEVGQVRCRQGKGLRDDRQPWLGGESLEEPHHDADRIEARDPPVGSDHIAQVFHGLKEAFVIGPSILTLHAGAVSRAST